ncbi:hypothetical protein [Sporosarcina sp. BP05]|uniref:hypothetical protein n=1 Tax=Sporosarcina sp. BP05 TaxID=2758726 RepID=UPI0016447AEF|nr:hypothetical protein [Sporosarcina sp. BP05]
MIGASLLVTIVTNRTSVQIENMMAAIMAKLTTTPIGEALVVLQQHIVMEATNEVK